MDGNELIGKVAAAYLEDRLKDLDSGATARYLLDSLSAEQTAAIAKAVLSKSSLSELVELKLPRQWLAGFGLPATCLTDERATYHRNAPCEKPALIIATPGDDERQSLADLTLIDSNLLRSHAELWVTVAGATLPITDQHRRWWLAALVALQDVASISLERYSLYVLHTRKAIDDGRTLLDALGDALPTLRWPRNSAMFRSLNEKTAAHASKWRALFQQILKRQACYLRKQTPANQSISAEELTTSFEKVRSNIPDQFHGVIRAFIAAPNRWNPQTEALADIEWELVKPVFDGLRRERFNLGAATQEFYDERDPALLAPDEMDYLANLATQRGATTEAVSDDVDFYRAHRGELKDDASLKSKWDRFIFGTPVETDDFLVGLAVCMESLFEQELPPESKRDLRITADKRTKNDLRKLNVDAGRFFALRYRGLRDLLGKAVFDVGPLFEYDSIHEQWTHERRYRPNQSLGRAALEIKFYVTLLVDDGAVENHRQLVWRYEPNAIASELYGDLSSRLSEHPFTISHAAREIVGPKGAIQALDLCNVRSLAAAFGKDRGSLVPVYRRDENDLAVLWRKQLEEARAQGFISPTTASRLAELFRGFADAYSATLRNFAKAGVATPEIRLQYEAFGRLIDAVVFDAKGDRNRELLLKPLLALGVAQIGGGAPAAIVAPWNPLRLQAMQCKATRVADLVKHLLTAPTVNFGDAGLYFKELQAELRHVYFPETILGWRERKPELLSLSDAYLDYSLHELPLADPEGSSDTNENPTESASQIVDMVQRYLALFPHEQANLSTVLYNCDAASLPQAVVNKISELHEDDSDMRCEVVLRHRQRDRLHRLYESILEASDMDSDGFVASEASRDFMARLRIGIMADEAPAPNPKDGPRTDLVFLHDVISRHSRLEWYREDATPVSLEQVVPSRWSRRRPSPRDEEKSIVYLCSPAQTKEGWAYLTALASFFKVDWDTDTARRYLPARQLDFHEPETESIFRETHNLANWVVNFDELLDRRQLLNQGVKVIRYKQAATQGRNLLVSSTASLGLLQSMLQGRIRNLMGEMGDDAIRGLAERFIEDANQISGDIVLRAAKRGRNASELIGIVLSHYLTRAELGAEKRMGFYFLDDYAEWLGQSEERIADLLVLCPEVLSSGEKHLSVVITEAKYIHESNLAEKRRESQKQLRDSMRRIRDALFGDPERLDRELWLARFSDLLLSGIPYGADDTLDLIGYRRAVREGRCIVHLRGYSHIFVSAPSDGTECSDFVQVAELTDGYQEVYSRAKTRALVQCYANSEAPDTIRHSVADVTLLQRRTSAPISPQLHIGSNMPIPNPPEARRTQDAATSGAPVAATESGSQVHPSASVQTWSSEGIPGVLGSRIASLAVTAEDEEWLRTTVNRTRAALQQFQLNSKLSGEPRLTPNAAIVRFKGASNLTVELVLKRRSEFLTTHGLNLIAARGEPGVVALYIARPARQVLHTMDVWKSWQPQAAHGNQQLLVAVKEDDGQLLFVSPTENAPHTLIAGATGSGKSVLMQNIILAIAATNTPRQAQMVLIDPKLGVDYFAFDGLPHLRGGIIEDQGTAVAQLNSLIDEMNRRYALLKANRCSNIFELYRKPNATERPPCLWIIHDEFAEWMMTDAYRDAVTNVVSRLGVKARAAGIFLVFAAQRPDANVMPLQLRSNLGNRLILKVDSEGTSEIALGERGAERLLGRGHLVARLEGHGSLIYGQVPLISSQEITQIVELLRHAPPDAEGPQHIGQ